MFFNHLKSFISAFMHFFLNLFILFFINLYYSDVFIYYFFGKLLKFKNLYATTLYEIIITKVNSAIIITILLFYPLCLMYTSVYIVSGLYHYEFKSYLKLLINLIKSYLLELFIYVCVILPFIIMYSKTSLHNNFTNYYIVQIHTYNNITNMSTRILILGLIMHIITVINERILKNKIQIPRKYVPIIGAILSLFGPFNSDIFMQLLLTGIVFIYIEIYKLKYYWNKNK
jgi:Sec-independent protein secretion pathway component TatC